MNDKPKFNQGVCRLIIVCMNLFYLIGISQMGNLPAGKIISNVLFIIAFIGLFIKMLFMKWSMYGEGLAKAFFLFLAIFIALLAYYFSGGPTVLKLLLFAFALKDVDKESALNSFIGSLILSMAFVIGSSVLGFTNSLYFRDKEAYALGFVNPNNAPMILVAVIAAINIKKYRDLKFWHFVVEIVVTLAFFKLTRSRTATLVLFFSYGILLLTFLFREHTEWFLKLLPFGKYVYWICAAISYYVATAYVNGVPIWNKLNILFSWRPYLWNKYYKVYSISLLGTVIDKVKLGTLDNAYLTLLFQYGIITFLLYGIIFTLLIDYSVKTKDLYLAIYVIVYEIYFMFEFGPLLINVNAVLIVFLVIYLSGELTEKSRYKIVIGNKRRYGRYD